MERKRTSPVCIAAALLVLLALIAAQMGVMVYFGFHKDGFDIDELWTYGLSNSYGEPFIEPKTGEWTSGARFKEYLSVMHGHEYLNVYDNQIADVHPPLYYLFMHAVCSLVRPVTAFTKWTGIGLNLACFAATQLALFMLCSRVLTKGKGRLWGLCHPLALCPVAAYGFGAGAISGAVFIRMYAMMTMWAVLLALVLTLLWQEGQRAWLMFLLKAVLIFGFMTQYYFVIYACMLCCAYFFAKLAGKKGKEAGAFVFSCALALIIAVGLFPWCIAHIFGGYRGRGAMEQAAAVNWNDLSRWASILVRTLSVQQFAGLLPALLAAAAALLAVCALRRLEIDRQACGMAVIGLAASMLYLTVIAVVSPYKVDRYIFCIYPLVVLGVWLLLTGALRGVKLSGAGSLRVTQPAAALLCMAALLAADGYAVTHGQVNYLMDGEDEYTAICEAHASLPCVVLGSNDMTENLLEFGAFDQVCVLDKDDVQGVLPAVAALGEAGENGFVLFQRYRDEAAVTQVAQQAGAQAQLLYTHMYDVYLIQ